MTNTTTPSASDSGLNLDHLEACPFCGSREASVCERDNLHFVMCDNCTAEGPAMEGVQSRLDAAKEWNRRAAPVSAPIAATDDVFIEQAVRDAKVYGVMPNSANTIGVGRAVLAAERKRAALANQPAPTAAPEQMTAGDVELIRVPAHEVDSYCRILSILGMEEEGDPVTEVQRLFDAAESQPSEAAPLDIETAAKAIYALLPPCQGVSAKEYPWQPGGNSMKQEEARDYARAALEAVAAPSLPAVDLSDEAKLRQFIVNWSAALYPNPDDLIAAIKANIGSAEAPAPTMPAGGVREAFEAWHRSKFETKHSTGQPTRDMHNGVYAEKYGPENQQLMWEAWQAALAHQPAQEQASTVWIADVVRDVAELPDRDSPPGREDMMLVTVNELSDIIERHAPAAPSQAAQHGGAEPASKTAETRMDAGFEGGAEQAAQHEAGDERAAFERHERKSNLQRVGVEKDGSGGWYENPCVQSAWEGWQARVALAASPVVRAQSEERALTADDLWAIQGALRTAGKVALARKVADAAAGAQQAHAGADAKDAERYRFIRHTDLDEMARIYWPEGEVPVGIELDEAIDAAIRAAQEGGAA